MIEEESLYKGEQNALVDQILYWLLSFRLCNCTNSGKRTCTISTALVSSLILF